MASKASVPSAAELTASRIECDWTWPSVRLARAHTTSSAIDDNLDYFVLGGSQLRVRRPILAMDFERVRRGINEVGSLHEGPAPLDSPTPRPVDYPAAGAGYAQACA